MHRGGLGPSESCLLILGVGMCVCVRAFELHGRECLGTLASGCLANRAKLL